jgi:hypothetical protein
MLATERPVKKKNEGSETTGSVRCGGAGASARCGVGEDVRYGCRPEGTIVG